MSPYDLAAQNGLLGIWIVARTPADRKYPCRCELGRKCSPQWCWCSGRVDLHQVPAHCCAHTNTPAVAAAAQGGGSR